MYKIRIYDSNKPRSVYRHLCGSLRISAFSALKGYFNTEIAAIRRELQEKRVIYSARSKPVNPFVQRYSPQFGNSDLFARRLYSNEKYILFEV